MPRDDGKDIRIAALKTAAVAKQQRAAEGLEKAIDKLIKSNEPMSFANVAREAGVSISYLYKYPRVKARILELRNQQQQVGKPNKPQTASDASKTVIITELRERIKKLEADLTGLRKANEGMAGRLYQLQDMQSMVERLKVENEGLKQKIAEQGKIPEDVGSILMSNSNVTPISQRSKLVVSEAIKAELEQLNISLNSTLTKRIKAVTEEKALAAITALKDQLTRGEVTNPGGWLATAIQDGWTVADPISPSQPQQEIFTVSIESQSQLPIKLISLDKLKTLNNIFQKDE
jgi:DNA repair exonuclease SbcCD ATPase subunit